MPDTTKSQRQAPPPRRGAIVRYAVRDQQVEARVLTLHRDGDATVEPRFFIRDDGSAVRGFIGGKVRLSTATLTSASAPAAGG